MKRGPDPAGGGERRAPSGPVAGDPAALAAVVRERVEEGYRTVREEHRKGASGSAVVELWCGWVDGLVGDHYRTLAETLEVPPQTLALLALGGYGRRELSPHSDLDLLLLHEVGAPVGGFVERFLYPLWDAGLDVQCTARTFAENLEIVRTDQRSRTSQLESRFLCGAEALSERHFTELVRGEILSRDVAPFIRAKLEEMEDRHRRYGHTVYLLEPNVKEGQGGLRDVHTALWIAKARFGAATLAQLLHQGVLPPAEIEPLEQARDFLLRIRNHLHLAAGRREDRLTFEYQDDAAPVFGFGDEAAVSGAERFLQAVYAAGNQIQHFSRAVIRRSTAGVVPRPGAGDGGAQGQVAAGVRLRDGEVFVSPHRVRRHPLTLLLAFQAAQDHDAELSPQGLETIREHLHLVDDRFRRDPAAVALFFKILRHPRRVATTLMRMHDVRFLDRFIPEFGRIFGRVQRDLYHLYPADVHSLFAVQELRRLARGEHAAEFPLLTRLSRDLQRPDILYLATLLHDVGKGEGHDHAQRGAEIALEVGDRMGLGPQDLDYLSFLVGQHLVLSHTAQGRDLHDEDLIHDFARQIGDPEALKMLYLLTFADIRAVAPGAWTAWKSLLVQELYEKTLHVLEAGAPDRSLRDERVQAVQRRLREAAASVAPEAEVQAFLSQIDHPQYLLANPLPALLRHLAVFARRAENPALARREVPEQGFSEVLLVTRDRPGLFTRVAGLLAAHGLNILSAVLNTRRDDWVLDVFHVSGPPGEPLGGAARWQGWEADLAAVLRGERSFADAAGTRLAQRSTLRRRKPRVRSRVRVDNTASRRFTVIDLQAADRLGLLYDVTRTFEASGLTIRLAKIATNLEQVSDSFYVERVGGGKLTVPEEIAHLTQALEAVAGGDDR